MQSFALAVAKLCDGGCKALRWQMQSFAWANAKLCVKVGLNRHRNVCPILDKRKGEKDSPYGVLSPLEISTEPSKVKGQRSKADALCHYVPHCPCCLQVEASCHGIYIKNLASEIEIGMMTAFKG